MISMRRRLRLSFCLFGFGFRYFGWGNKFLKFGVLEIFVKITKPESYARSAAIVKKYKSTVLDMYGMIRIRVTSPSSTNFRDVSF